MIVRPTLVGSSASPVNFAATNATANPGGVAVGDLLVVVTSTNDAAGGGAPDTSGWAPVPGTDIVGTGGTRLLAWQKYATEDDVMAASWSWTWSQAHWNLLGVSVWRGARLINLAGFQHNPTDETATLPGLESGPESVLLAWGFNRHDQPRAWSPAGLTELEHQERGNRLDYEDVDEGTTDSYLLTADTDGTGNQDTTAVAMLIEPAPPPPTPRRAGYEFFVDWDNDGGLNLSNFEAGIDGWAGFPLPPVPPDPPDPVQASVRSVASAQSDATSFTVARPAGTVEGDVLVACQTSDVGAASALTTPTGGAAWTQLGTTISGGTGALHTKVWWKVAGDSEPTSYGFTQASGADSVASVTAIRDADTTRTPVIGQFSPFSSGTTIPTPGITPTFDNDVELRWVGAQYTTPPPQTQTKTYDATWSASWYGFGKRSGTRAYQGNNQLGDGTGNQYGKIGFNDAQIRSDLSGATIDRVELRMSNEHSWNNSGLTARFGSHNNADEPAGSSSTSGSFNRSSHSWNKGQTKYVDLPVAIGNELRDNTTKGITTGRTGAGNRSDYGYFRGHNASASQRPRLRITYTTAGSQPVTISGPAGLTQRTNQSSNDFTAGALSTRQLRSTSPTGTLGFTASHPFVRAHGVTIAVASEQPEPDPELPDESPTLTHNTTEAFAGSGSLQVEWSDGEEQYAHRDLTGLIVGRTYELTAHVLIPDGGVPVRVAVQDVATSVPVTAIEEWVPVALEFTATATTHLLQVLPDEPTDGGEQALVDAVQLIGPEEDITHRVLGLRTAVDISYGRDHARSLSAISPGQTGLELDNRSRDYTPDNPNSPLAGMLGPGRPVLIRANWQGERYNLFWGHLDDYTLDPDRNSRSVQVTALDALSLLRGVRLSTTLYSSVRTGEAIGVILDQIGWPADRRDLDPGASVLRWWWGESDDAFDVLSDVVEAEGPNAFAFVSSAGDFVFRDRHHRLQREASLTVQATLRDTGTEPNFSAPVDYDIGFKEIVNSVEVAVEEREPVHQEVVWEEEGLINLAALETRIIRVQADNPFTNAITPVQGARVTDPSYEKVFPAHHDMVVRSGDVAVSLSRTSGQSTEIRLEAGPTAAVIEGMRLRATPVPVVRTVQIRAEDEQSIAAHGRRSYDGDLARVGVHDVASIAQLILGQRSQRLPVMTVTVVGAGHTERLAQILIRDLSDRVHLVDDETFTDHPYFVERIAHNIGDVGHDHRATFGMERVREQHPNVFTFDDPDRGFDDGVFGASGIDNPDTLFTLDQSNLDEGMLGH